MRRCSPWGSNIEIPSPGIRTGANFTELIAFVWPPAQRQKYEKTLTGSEMEDLWKPQSWDNEADGDESCSYKFDKILNLMTENGSFTASNIPLSTKKEVCIVL